MSLGDPYLPQPSQEMILEEWKNLYMPKEARPVKLTELSFFETFKSLQNP